MSAVSGVISRQVLPVCGSLCVFCHAFRARSRQPVISSLVIRRKAQMTGRLKTYVSMLQRTLCVCQRYTSSNVNSSHIQSLKNLVTLYRY
ncbi:hypothetical protein HA466_0188350 [Hirschfeldia incana]|nr:hypothetical protein HA466_0188350 [Hirschfeldia incana]